MKKYTIDRLRGNKFHGRSVLVTSKATGNRHRVDIKDEKNGTWLCDCRIFFDKLRRGESRITCPHIDAVMSRRRKKAYSIADVTEQAVPDPQDAGDYDVIACNRCGSTDYTNSGTKPSGKPVYRCRACRKRFVHTLPGFEKTKYSPEIITGAINMVMSGMSYRKTTEHLRYVYDMRIPHTTILKWVQKYSRIITEYARALMPITGDVWSADEAVIRMKKTRTLEPHGNVNWLWSAIDPKTRYVLASRITPDSRTMADAKSLMEMASELSTPKYVVTDSLQAYDRPVRRLRGAFHIKTKSVRDGFTNMAIERYHNEIREKLKTCRGLDNDDSCVIFANMLWIHHNFVRPHMGLDGKTPAEEAGVITAGTAKGKYKSLISMASPRDGRRIAQKLGAYNGLVTVTARQDAVFVRPKKWLSNDDWRAVNAILHGLGFLWFFDHARRCWARFGNNTASIRVPPRQAMPVKFR